jgi:hypothetical protein
MPRIRSAVLAALLAAFPASLPAQGLDGDAGPSRTLLSVGFTAGRGGGALGRQVGDGMGGSFRSVRRLDGRGVVGLRIEGGALLQDRRSDSIPGSSGAEVHTSNTLVFAGIGPQVQLPRGPVRPYAHAFAGLHYLFTRYGVRGPSQQGGTVALEEAYEDGAWAWGGGAGVYVPLRRGVMLDAGVTWREGGEAGYLIQDYGPVRGETDLRVAHLGVTIGL